jgi:GMP synthase-like glutamine amidotransferase
MTGGRVLVLENSASSGLRRFDGWWREDGLDLTTVRAYRDPLPDRLDGLDGLVILGGGMMPTDDATAPWLAGERGLAAAALDRGMPTLGICLGGQLLAHVAGGTVRRSFGEPEVGSTPISVEPAAADDPLFSGLPAEVRAIEHHQDAITALPPRAVWLASSDRCPYQAFRLGQRAWGVQFHPEASADRVARWDRQELIDQGFDPDAIVSRAQRDEPASAPVWRQFARRFAAVVARAREEAGPRNG